jgi:hypothetical protein
MGNRQESVPTVPSIPTLKLLSHSTQGEINNHIRIIKYEVAFLYDIYEVPHSLVYKLCNISAA